MLLLIGGGLAAGFIDSIIGGGGLIALPLAMLKLGIHPVAIGTNKIGGVCSTFAALAVYGLGRRVPWAIALKFAVWVGIGSVAGASLSRVVAPFYSVMLVIGTCLVLATMFARKRIIKAAEAARHEREWALTPTAVGLGLLCGFYDGAWGPGGGTFMFLALLYVAPIGLVGAMAAAKIANFASAFLAVATYAYQGNVNWSLGAVLGVSLGAGAVVGARLALSHADRILTPMLAVITALLLWKLANG
ncbi:MAG: TSUP family transporter [Elusimicrobia bacterium]|nr:TSUP family transporter [Elusimicrobiota bacterium]